MNENKIFNEPLGEEEMPAAELDGQTALEEVISVSADAADGETEAPAAGEVPVTETAEAETEKSDALEENEESTDEDEEFSDEDEELSDEDEEFSDEDDELSDEDEEPSDEDGDGDAAADETEERTRVFAVTDLEDNGADMDGLKIAMQLCDAVLNAVGKDIFHGGVRPDNISVGTESVTLGSRLEHGVGEFTPQELEYMAPELFWDGSRSPTADVYSLGLVLYALYNHARMPFWPEDGDATPNVRASALQKRMNNEPLPAPSAAGEELSAIILRALSFAPEERWHDAEELKNALGDCAEQQPLASDLAMVVTAMTARAGGNRRAPREEDEMSSPFVEELDGEEEEEREEPIPVVKVKRSHRRLAQTIVYLALALAIIAIVLLLRRCAELDSAARVTPTPPVVAAMQPSEQEKIINGNMEENPGEENAPGEEPGTEPEEAPDATPEPTPASVIEAEPIVEYKAYQENVSWKEAVARCQEMGGTLAMPTNYTEFQEITAKCEEAGLTFVWLNAYRNEQGTWVDADGNTAAFFFAWGNGEPSEKDSGDGAAEDYFLLWNMAGRWSGNDSRENPLAGYWNSYAGKIGYVCKIVTYPLSDAEGAAGETQP